MKKLGLVMLVMLIASNVFAAQVSKEILSGTINEATPASEADINIQDAKTVTFFTTIDCNRTTASVTATVTAAVSLNGTDWTDISWFDVAGGATPQTTETTTLKKQLYVAWLDDRIEAKYLRVRVQSSNMYTYNVTSGDSASMTVTVVQEK